jgi:hypothetical protein
MDAAGVIRTFLLVDVIGMSLLGIVYLLQRRLERRAFFGWSLLALLVPVLGPFLVIASRPGSWNEEFSFGKILRGAGRSLRDMAVTVSSGGLLTRFEHSRLRQFFRRGANMRK